SNVVRRCVGFCPINLVRDAALTGRTDTTVDGRFAVGRDRIALGHVASISGDVDKAGVGCERSHSRPISLEPQCNADSQPATGEEVAEGKVIAQDPWFASRTAVECLWTLASFAPSRRNPFATSSAAAGVKPPSGHVTTSCPVPCHPSSQRARTA